MPFVPDTFSSSQVETVVSMLKGRLESFVRGRTAWTHRRELRLKVLTHNIMILLRIEVFYTAVPDTFSSAQKIVLTLFSSVFLLRAHLKMRILP